MITAPFPKDYSESLRVVNKDVLIEEDDETVKPIEASLLFEGRG